MTAFSALLMAAQAAAASLTGTVRDGLTGETVQGVVITLTDLDRATVTDSLGRYTFAGVSPGPQHLVARRIGYTPRALHALVPSQGTVEIHLALHPHAIVLGAVTTRGRLPVRGLEPGDSAHAGDRGVSFDGLRHHPWLAEPDAVQALGGGAVVLDPEAPDGLHVRGGSADHVAYLLDGFPVFNPVHAGGRVSGWNPDALAWVRLETRGGVGGPDALSGIVSARTRAPGPAVRVQGGTSSTQARLTVDGPVGGRGAGYLVSLRTGYPGSPGPKPEASYVQGESGDWLVTLSAPVAGGRVRVLGYGSDSEMDAAAVTPPESAGAPAPGRHRFGWTSRSLGASWSRDLGRWALELRAWRAAGDAGAVWSAEPAPVGLASRRSETGALAAMTLAGAQTRSSAGLRAQLGETDYATDGWALRARTPLAAAFAEQAWWSRTLHVDVGLVATAAAGALDLSPRAELRWRPAAAVTLSAGYARRAQFGQSLRNPESVARALFPADLYVGASRGGVPVARSDFVTAAVELRPAAGLRLDAHAYAGQFTNLALVAPRSGDPFATTGYVVGRGAARGLALTAAASGARYGVLLSYGLRHVRRSFADTSYVPDHGAVHTLDAGLVVHPSATWSLRVGAAGALGRRGTALAGPLEWESCSLGDRGCEFAGSPRYAPGDLGLTPLPDYLRVDVGVRKHWHLRVAHREAVIALFGTLTNVLGRRNVLTVATDPLTGEETVVPLRPTGPLVVGLDWRF